MRPFLTTFRPLIVFWCCVLALLAGTALALQFIGPPQRPVAKPPLPVAAAPVTPPEPAAPARAVASKPDPAPALKMTLASIPDPDPALQEPAPDFADRMLPRIGAKGRAPAAFYAAAFDPAERHPRVALVIDGAGLDRALTAQANRMLPAAVDFAFSAYVPPADGVRLARDARRLGRECLVSVPMEPSGFPTEEEGDRSLMTGSDPGQLRMNLEWALSGVQGCVGATGGSDGMGGERFADSRQAYGDVLGAVAQRGLVYLDPRPGAAPPDVAPALPYVADVVLDASSGPDTPADAQAIDRNLAALEQIAARRGAAIGLAGPLTPVLLDRVSVWAQGLAARGLVLAPLTALPPPRRPQAASR